MLLYRIEVIVVGLFLIVSSCGKDVELELVRTDYIGSELKIDGYYISPEHSDGVMATYFFYQNGTVLYGGSYDKEMSNEEIQNIWIEDSFDDLIKDTKDVWGVFNIDEGSIEYETWESSNGGPLKTVVRFGEILDNSTFVVTSLDNNYTEETVALSDTFYFEKFSPKPDSLNRFIP